MFRPRSAFRWIRFLPERLAHSGRRNAARRVVDAHGPVGRLVFVCLGNVCRSPYAEWSARARAEGLGVRVELLSRGFIGPDRQSPEAAKRVSAARGVDLSTHRSRLLDPHELRPRDLVLVMNEQQRARISRAPLAAGITTLILGDLDPFPIDRREIPDPWGLPDEVFSETYARIDRILDALLLQVRDRSL